MRRPKLREETASVIEEIADENDYSTMDRAITHALREAGYNV